VTDGSNSMQDDRYAPPRAHVEDVTAAGNAIELAGRGRRLGASLIDLAIAFVVIVVLSRLTPWNPWSGAENRAVWGTDFVNTAVGFVIFAAVHGVLLARRGQTVGKMLLGMRITRTDGSAASLGRLLGLRYGVGYAILALPAFGQIYSVFDALLIFQTSRRCLHDQIADTIVVKT
jgi:uncharacterized RDD family membrane protein YckC